MLNIFKRFLMMGILLFPLFALAAATSPLDILQTTSQQLLSELNNNRSALKQDPTYVPKLVRRILIPHVDLNMMARSVLSRDVWQSATAAQRKQFTDAFTDLLIGTYGSAISSYSHETVQFLPVRGGIDANQKQVDIDSKIIRPGGPPVAVSYRLMRQGNDWKVYDFSVEGISMLQSFKSQFASQLSQNANIDALIQALKQHNQQVASNNNG